MSCEKTNQLYEIVYACPSTPKGECLWEGRAEDIFRHFQRAHGNFVIGKNTVDVNVVKESEENRLMAGEWGCFLVQIKVSKNTMLIQLRYLGTAEDACKIRYAIEIACGKFGFKNEASDAYNPVFNVKDGVEVDLQTIGILENGGKIQRLTVGVHVFQNQNDSFNYLSEDEDGVIYNDEWKLLENLNSGIKCDNCQCNMIPPIYMCADGHSVCGKCKGRNCGVCEGEITDLRNVELEERANTMTHPCRYASQGCTEKFQPVHLRMHELSCDFCTYKCELCVFHGRAVEMKSHFRIAHPSTKQYETMSGVSFPRGANLVIICGDGVFYCSSRALDTYIEWRVVFCGPMERCFTCEVRIAGKKHTNNPVHYFLRRDENVFKWTVPFEELKAANVKEKNAALYITSY